MQYRRRRTYVKGWERISLTVRIRDHWTCQICHAREGDPWVSRRTGEVVKIVLHCAHKLPHNKQTTNLDDLFALCPSCHGIFDAENRRIEAALQAEVNRHLILLKRRRYIVGKIRKVQKARAERGEFAFV